MNEFLDRKDSGTAILSHFYLLTGCAGSVWLEGPSQLLQFTGILALGVGDAMVSVYDAHPGKRTNMYVLGFDCWQTDGSTPVVSDYIKNTRRQRCVFRVDSCVRVVVAAVWNGRGVFGMHVPATCGNSANNAVN